MPKTEDAFQTYYITAAVTKFTIAKGGTTDFSAVVATDGSAPLLGVFEYNEGADKVPGTTSVSNEGIRSVRLGGTVGRFVEVTAGAGGKAVVAQAGDFILGITQEAGVLDDVVDVELRLGGEKAS